CSQLGRPPGALVADVVAAAFDGFAVFGARGFCVAVPSEMLQNRQPLQVIPSITALPAEEGDLNSRPSARRNSSLPPSPRTTCARCSVPLYFATSVVPSPSLLRSPPSIGIFVTPFVPSVGSCITHSGRARSQRRGHVSLWGERVHHACS